MATALRHSSRLLSPGESLLFALLPNMACIPPRRPHLQPDRQQRRHKGDSRKRRGLPADFDLSRILREENANPVVREKERLNRYKLDEDIEVRWVMVRDKLTGKLSTPQLLVALLSEIDRSTHSVRLIATDGPQPDTSIVEVIARQELLNLQNEADAKVEQQRKASAGKGIKQLELNWAISANDLEMKLKQLEGFLAKEKTKNVELLLAHKKRQRRASHQEAQGTLDKVRERIEAIGAKEKRMDGEVGGSATLTVERKTAAD